MPPKAVRKDKEKDAKEDVNSVSPPRPPQAGEGAEEVAFPLPPVAQPRSRRRRAAARDGVSKVRVDVRGGGHGGHAGERVRLDGQPVAVVRGVGGWKAVGGSRRETRRRD